LSVLFQPAFIVLVGELVEKHHWKCTAQNTGLTEENRSFQPVNENWAGTKKLSQSPIAHVTATHHRIGTPSLACSSSLSWFFFFYLFF
jgi:hypothetical protein